MSRNLQLILIGEDHQELIPLVCLLPYDQKAHNHCCLTAEHLHSLPIVSTFKLQNERTMHTFI